MIDEFQCLFVCFVFNCLNCTCLVQNLNKRDRWQNGLLDCSGFIGKRFVVIKITKTNDIIIWIYIWCISNPLIVFTVCLGLYRTSWVDASWYYWLILHDLRLISIFLGICCIERAAVSLYNLYIKRLEWSTFWHYPNKQKIQFMWFLIKASWNCNMYSKFHCQNQNQQSFYEMWLDMLIDKKLY